MASLEDKISEIQQKLAVIDGYRKVSEWLNNGLVSHDDLSKVISDDILLTIAQDLTKYARAQAEAWVSGSQVVLRSLDGEDVQILKKLADSFRAKTALITNVA